jgi:glyoxylase-like metal-dependent hydrolase (beta-lactamase superfamily II)
MQNYVYLVGDPETREAAVIDAAWEIDAIVDAAAHDGYTITKALVTHFHPDHLGGRFMGMSVTGATELVAKLGSRRTSTSTRRVRRARVRSLAVRRRRGRRRRHRPGRQDPAHLRAHARPHAGSQCFLVDGNLISGDTLFIGSCGRTDCPAAIRRSSTTA